MAKAIKLPASNPFRPEFEIFTDVLKSQDAPKNTELNYTTYVRDFLVWIYGKGIADINKVEWQDLRDYQKYLRNDRNLKGNTINQEFAAIKKFYRAVLEKEWNDAAVGSMKYEIFRGTVPITNEVDVILSHTKKNLTLWLMFALLAFCGLRVSELVNLTYSDIRRERMSLYVKPSKNHEDREIPISPAVLDYLTRYVRSLPVMPKKEDYIFPGRKANTHLTAPTINNRVNAVMDQLGWRDRSYTPHSFRRYFGCIQYLMHPDDLPRLSAIMGHRQVSSTMVYIKLAAAFKARHEDIGRIDAFLKGENKLCLM